MSKQEKYETLFHLNNVSIGLKLAEKSAKIASVGVHQGLKVSVNNARENSLNSRKRLISAIKKTPQKIAVYDEYLDSMTDFMTELYKLAICCDVPDRPRLLLYVAKFLNMFKATEDNPSFLWLTFGEHSSSYIEVNGKEIESVYMDTPEIGERCLYKMNEKATPVIGVFNGISFGRGKSKDIPLDGVTEWISLKNV